MRLNEAVKLIIENKPGILNEELNKNDKLAAELLINKDVIGSLLGREVEIHFGSFQHLTVRLFDSNIGKVYFYLPNFITEKMRKLILNGVSPNIKDFENESILTLAVFGGNKNIDFIKFLLEAGADPNSTDISGKSALALAKGNPKIQKILRQYGAKE